MRRISATPLSRETIERYRATPRPNAPDSYARAFKGEDVVTYSLLRELCPSSCRERTLVAQIMSAPCAEVGLRIHPLLRLRRSSEGRNQSVSASNPTTCACVQLVTYETDVSL